MKKSFIFLSLIILLLIFGLCIGCSEKKIKNSNQSKNSKSKLIPDRAKSVNLDEFYKGQNTINVFMALNFTMKEKKFIKKLLYRARKTFKNYTWTFMTKYHVTLQFIGPVTKSECSEVISVLKDSKEHFNPFEIRIGKFYGGFPKDDIPKILWLGIETVKNNKLNELVFYLNREISKRLNSIKLEDDYIPHITLGRHRGRLNEKTNKIEILNSDTVPYIDKMVDSIRLYQSVGGTYRPVYRVNLN